MASFPQLEPAWRSNKGVPLATSDVTEMVHFVASDTRLVRWCSRVYYVLDYSLNKRLSRATGERKNLAIKVNLTEFVEVRFHYGSLLWVECTLVRFYKL